MKERIESLLSALEHDPTNQEALASLEEIVAGGDVSDQAAVIVDALDRGWRRLAAAARWEAACEVIEMELVLAGDPGREGFLLKEQARICDEELFDQTRALDRYRKVAALDPTETHVAERIEAIEAERANWQQIADKFVEQAAESTEPSLRAQLLYAAAERTYKNARPAKEKPGKGKKGKKGKEDKESASTPQKDISGMLRGALEADPNHLKAARLLEKVLQAEERWAELAELYTSLAQKRRAKEDRVQMLLAAAYTYAYRLDDKDSAALYYSEVLDFTPGNQAALKFLVQHYEAKEDWDHLVAVYEDALRGKLAPEDELAMLMQVAMLQWKVRGNAQAAEGHFRRLRKMSPAHPGMLTFYRNHFSKKEDIPKLLQILSDAQRATNDPAALEKINKEIAQLAASEGGNVEKAIDAWKAVLRQEPSNAEARAELKRMYRQSEKWNALIETLKSEVEFLPDGDAAGKVRLLEEMIEIYREKLSLEAMVINTYNTILQLDPANEAALEALTGTYESAGRWNDLVVVLKRRADGTADPARKVALLERSAALWIERFNNFNRAVEPLEEILALDPRHEKAIETLKGVYQKRRAWKPLLDLLEKEAGFLEGAARRDRFAEMAKLSSERLSDHARAIELWKKALEVDPETPEALATLEKLTEREKDWAGLAEVIEMRASRAGGEAERVELFSKLGTVCKERLREPSRAADAWKRVLEIQPGHPKAVRSLREAYLAAEDWEALEKLYAEGNDWEGLVEVLGTAADRVEDPETKKKLSFRCTEIYDAPIGQPDRAVRHYERVLSVDSGNERAARALVPIYRRGEKWSRLAAALEVVLGHAVDRAERVALIAELRELAATQLNNRGLAFKWASRAFVEDPRDAAVRETLEAAAADANAFEELIAIYKAELDKFEGSERIDMERHVGRLAIERLGAVDDAVAGFRSILERNPGDPQALEDLERIFRAAGRIEDLIGIFKQRIGLATDDAAKRELILEMARLYEEGLDDTASAAANYGTVLEMFPEDTETLLSLERLARQGEKWDELCAILERRRELGGASDPQWKDVTFQMAVLYDQKIGDAPKAIGLFEEILDREPGNADAISAMEHFLGDEKHRVAVARILEPHLELNENWRRLAWVLSILIEDSKNAAARLELNLRLATLYAEKLGDEHAAFDIVGAALKENPADTGLWERLTALATSLGVLSDLAEALSGAYRSGALDADKEIDLAGRLADLLDAKLGRPAEAEPYHLRVLKADPGAGGSSVALESLYTSAERWDDLLGLYRTALDSLTSPSDRLEMLLKICFLVDEVLHDVPRAVEAYKAVLEIKPGNVQAVRALTALYEESGRYESLADLLTEEIGRASDADAVALRYRLAEILEQFLGRPADALDGYEEVLRVDPDHLKAQEAVERLVEIPELRQRAASVLERTYEHQGAAEPLARVLAVELEDQSLATSERISLLRRVADLKERRLSDADGAFEALAAAFKADPTADDVSAELRRVASDYAMSERYAVVLDAIIPKVEDDMALRVRLMGEVARLYDERIGDFDRAKAAYRRLLDADPGNPETALPAVEALDRLFTASESWQELLAVLRVKVDLQGDPSLRKEVLQRMAEVEESVLERPAEAIRIYREVLDADASDMRALLGLERLYEREESWRELIEILRRRVAAESSSDLRRELLMRAASLFEERLSDTDEAIAAYHQVCDEVGPDAVALDALCRLYVAAERWRDLLDAYEAKEPLIGDPAPRAELMFLMGDLLRTKLAEPERAVERLGETLAVDPRHAAARASLETLLDTPVKLDVIKILKPICEAEGDFERVLRFTEIEAVQMDDPLARSRVLRQAAEVAEIGLSDTRRAFELVSRAFRDGTTSEDLGRLIDDLERLAAQIGAHEAVVTLYRQTAPDILDGDLQVRCNLRVAQIADELLGNAELAREYYVKVLDTGGDNPEAMDALERIYERGGQHLELYDIYRRKAQVAVDEKTRRAILVKQARLCEEKIEDLSGAMTTYEAILASEPGDREAALALERLYPKAERWADLMDLLDRRVEQEPSEAVGILHRLGRLAEEKLGDDERGLDYFRRALEIDPGHAATLSSLEAAMADDARRGRVAAILEPVYKERGDWAKLAGALEARLEFCGDPFERKDLLRRIGTVYEDQLEDLDKAFETFARLFAEDVEDKGSWDILTRLASVLDKWPRLAEVYAAALDHVVGDTPVTAELAFNLGEIYETRLARPEDAKAAYRRVLGFSPDDPKAFSAVERMLLATTAWNDLLELYRDAADAALDMGQRKEFIFKIANIQEEAREDKGAAIKAYRDIMEIDDRDAPAIAALDRLLCATGRFEDLSMHLRAQIDAGENAAQRNALRCRLGRLQEEDLKDLASAVDVYEEALRDGGCAEAQSALERLIMSEDLRLRIAEILEPVYREAGEWKKLVVILGTEADLVDGAAEKVAKLKEIAALHDERGRNYLLAFKSLARAFEIEPSDRALLADLTRLTGIIEGYDGLAQVVERVLDRIYDTAFKAEVLHLQGSIYDQRLDMPRKAIDAYRGVLEIDETDGAALDALEGLYNLVGDWSGLVDVLTRKAGLAGSPSDRAELLRSRASIQEDLMSCTADATESYKEALDADPTSTVTMDALERLHEVAEAWTDLIEVRRARLDVTAGTEERLEILRAIARVHEEKICEAFDAINAWRAALEEGPNDRESIAALGRLYAKESMFPELLENLRLERELAADDSSRVDVGCRIGDLLEKQIGDLAGAVDSYDDVLAVAPTHEGAIAALERLMRDESVRARAIEVLEPLHRQAARWDRLAEVLELKLEIVTDPAERIAELLGLAELHESGRSAPKQAFEVYTRAFAEDPSRAAIMDAMERLAAAENLWTRLSAVYLERVDQAYDAEVERAILNRLGEVREVRLGDSKGAIEVYRRALDGGGADPRLLSSLDRLYEREREWPELDEILEREIAAASDPGEVARLRLRESVIREREFGDVASAIDALKGALGAVPDSAEAVASLEAFLTKDDFVEDIVAILTPIYEARDERHKVSTLFEHRLRVASSDGDRVRLFGELALHQEAALGDASAAFDAYAQAFLIDPQDGRLLGELERLAAELGRWAALADVAEKALEKGRLDPTAEVELGLKVAEWASTQVGDPMKAEARYRAVLQRVPDHAEALAALETLLKNLGRFEDLLPVMKQRAEGMYDFAAKKEILVSMARIAETELGDPRRAMAAYRQVLEMDEADVDALDALAALTESTGDYKALASYLLARAQYTIDPQAANLARHKAAALFVTSLAEPARAAEVYREILDVSPNDDDALSQLEALYEQLERFSDLKDLYHGRLDLAQSSQERVPIFRRLAVLAEMKFDAADDAAGYLNEILLIEPGDAEAASGLERLYTKSERWQDLVDLLEGRADRARDEGDAAAELSFLTRVGEIWGERLSDPDRAVAIYERVLERDPEHTRALSALAALYEASADWERCAEVLRKAAATGKGGVDGAEVHFRLARLHASHLSDEAGALEELKAAVALDPGHLEANRALTERCRKSGDVQGLLEALMREEAHLSEAREKVHRLLEIAELQAGPLSDRVGAAASLERAKALAPASKDVLLKLSDAYVAAGRESDAIPVIESLVAAETEGGKKRSKQAAVYHQRLAKAYLSRGERDKALSHLDEAYKMDIANVEVLITLGKLHYEGGDYDKAAKLFRALLLQKFDPRSGASKADIYFYVGDITLKQGDAKKAKGMFQRGLDEDAGHAGCKEGLAKC
ncbi:MAG: hypothetical protein PHU25_13720 [Deltaproteobacteria bacterium]|nr:hypothetical protein [Deltaproteobacteria bacterium]